MKRASSLEGMGLVSVITLDKRQLTDPDLEVPGRKVADSPATETRWGSRGSFISNTPNSFSRKSYFTSTNNASTDEGEEEGAFFTDIDSVHGSRQAALSAKLQSPKRMFGKGMTEQASFICADKGIDAEGAVNHMSHLQNFRVNPASLPISASVVDEVNINIHFADLSSIQHICDGSNSNLFKCSFDGKPVIAKRLKIDRINTPHVLSEFEFESEFLRRAYKCPHLVRIYGSGCDKIQESDLPEDMSYEPESQLSVVDPDGSRHVLVPFVVIERLNGGTLSYFLKKPRSYHARPFPLLRCFSIWKELAEALLFIHERFQEGCCVIHRDLKPDNICFDDDDRLRLIDFGLSICIKRAGGGSSSGDTYDMTGGTGSLRYMSPEVALSQPYNDRTDIYSFGIIAYEVLTGVAPFGSMDRAKFLKRVAGNHERPDVNIDDYGRRITAPQKAKDLMVACWQPDISKRPSAAEVLRVCEELVEEEATRLATKKGCLCS